MTSNTSYSLTVGADIGEDNGVFDGGSFSTVEDAIQSFEEHWGWKVHEYYGSYVKDLNDQVVAQSLGYWGDISSSVYWHCMLDAQGGDSHNTV